MRLSCVLPSLGPLATPENLVRVAQRAEALGYDTLWVCDRLLYPVKPRTPYPVTADGVMPEAFKIAMDPVEALTWAAAHTRRIRVGTSVLNIPFYHPVVLARRLATLDVLSGGRLRVGLGHAWSADELEAVGADPGSRGRRADEFIRVLQAMWGPDPVSFRGEHFRVAPSFVGLKPVQRPHPPLYLAGYVPAALRRAAAIAHGWIPSSLPFDVLAQMERQLRDLVRAAGLDPAAFEIVYIKGFRIGDAAADEAKREPLAGSPAQVRGDLARLRDLGVAEYVAWPAAATIDGVLADLERLRSALPGR